MNSGESKPRESLNPFLANRLRITCQYIDKLLGEIEGILNAANSKAAFPRYAADILPVQRRTIEDYIARVRAQLERMLEGQGIARESPSIPASRAVHVHLGEIEAMRSVCERYAEAGSASLGDAVEEASKALVSAWSERGKTADATEQLVRDAIVQAVQMRGGKLQREITALADQLGGDLRQCAADLALPDAPGEDEFRALVRGAPAFEAPAFGPNISRPWISRLLGRKAVERSVARQMARRMPQALYNAVETYWQLMKDWSDSVIGQLKRRFETYAESYRAQAQQELGGRELTREESGGIRESLARLKTGGGGNSSKGVRGEGETRMRLEEAV